MAYETTNPPALVANRVGASGGAIWVYRDGDSLATVNGINYITNAAQLGMLAGDKVIHMDTTTETTTDLVVTAGATTGTASGALCSAIEPVGETSIALESAGTGTILVGDIINFSTGDTTDYRVTTGDTDISNGGTLVITPGLAVATAVGTSITIKSNVLNLTDGAKASKTLSGKGATYTLTLADAGSDVLFDRAAGIVYTLPAPKVGLEFDFTVTVDLTSNAYTVNTDAATTFIVGSLDGGIEGAATNEIHFANGSTHIGVSMNKTTTGGLIGGSFKMKCISSTLWRITGNTSCTATPATPFTT